MAKREPLTDEKIVATARKVLKSSNSYSQTTLSRERELVLKYYYGDLPAKMGSGQSGYRSLDLFDSVESGRAQLLEVFAGNRIPVKFRATGMPLPKEVLAAISAYVNKVLFETNPGFQILDDVIFDALTARIGAVKVYWKKDKESFSEDLPEVPDSMLEQLASDDAVEAIDAEVDAATQLATGTIHMTKDTSRLVIECVKPENFLISTTSANIKERPVGELITRRLSAWKAEGYAEADLRKALVDEEDMWSAEADARNNAADGDDDEDPDDLDPEVTLLEVWMTLDVKQDGHPRGYRLLIAGSKLLEKEESDLFPYVDWAAIRVAHQTHGASFSKSVMPTQDAKTVLTRGILDHVVRTNNPRYEVLVGTIDSARELLENKLGGVVNVKKPDGIRPLPQASLNPFAFQTIQLLDSDLEDTTGLSRLSQGTDKNVVSNQNSRGLMQDMAQKSEQRFRIIARRFAENFLRPLALLVYQLARAKDTKESMVLVGGQEQAVKPSDWPELSSVSVDLWLAPEIRKARAAELMQTKQALEASPSTASLMTPKAHRDLPMEAMKLLDIEDAEGMLLPEPPPPQLPPEVQFDQEMRKAEMALKERQQQLLEMKTLKELEGEAQAFYLNQLKTQAELAMKQRQQAAKEFNEAWERVQAELTPPEGKRAFFAV